jgi:RHS repeat-associated protein
VTIADYDEQDRLTQYGDIAYTHTEAGERLTRTDSSGTTTYTYDAHTNLRQVSLPDGAQIEYLIDGRDRRVGKKIDGVVQKTWIYRDQLSPVAQFDDDGNLTHRFVYAEQGHSPSWMVMIDPVTEAETVYRFITDHLGSVRLVIDVAAGAVAQRIDYGPFGEVLFDSNPGFQPFGFAGGIYDRDTGLVRFGARDYDPEIGRWATRDAMLFAGGDGNLYRYSSADPLNRIDSAGYADLIILDTHLDAEIIADAQRYAIDPNEIVIVAHGNPFSLVHRTPRGNVRIDLNELVELITKLPKYTKEMPVRILGCEAGEMEISGGEPVAQLLADVLLRAGGENPVYGATEKVFATSPKIYKRDFEWIRFEGRAP